MNFYDDDADETAHSDDPRTGRRYFRIAIVPPGRPNMVAVFNASAGAKLKRRVAAVLGRLRRRRRFRELTGR